MSEHAHPATWLEATASGVLALAVLCAAVIVGDMIRGPRPRMRVMQAVWPVTALYLGPLALWAYLRLGRPDAADGSGEASAGSRDRRQRDRVATALAVSHCGAGCTLGDILAESAVFFFGLQIAGLAFWPELIGDYTFALLFGIGFQYAALRPMSKAPACTLLRRAFTIDFLSLTAFEVGLFAWMAFMAFALYPGPHLAPNTATYWFLMQIGMALGFVTAYPVNAWLLRKGIKERM